MEVSIRVEFWWRDVRPFYYRNREFFILPCFNSLMATRNTWFRVFVAFLLLSIFALFFPNWVPSLFTIVILAVIFQTVLGVSWQECFKLSIINYVWILVLNIFMLAAMMMAVATGGVVSGMGVVWVILFMVVGVPLTSIVLNWRGKRKLPRNMLDKLLPSNSNRRPRHKRFRRKH